MAIKKITGTAGNDSLVGSAGFDNDIDGLGGNDTLIGQAGNDTLRGGLGADSMVGGNGNDTYYVDDVGDKVVEGTGASSGIDTVFTSLAAYTLGANVENGLVWNRTLGAALTGNTLNNALTGGVGNDTLDGGAGNDTLDGGAGADLMKGGTGNDVYYVDSASDVVTELANQGTDLVNTSLAYYQLGANLEAVAVVNEIDPFGNIRDVKLVGNAVGNSFTGGAGNDTIDGGSGADTMRGGLGGDLYYVDNVNDVVIESIDGGNDQVNTSLAYYKAADNIDTVTVWNRNTGSQLVAHDQGMALYGNGGADTLTGGAGQDDLFGQVGNDVLDGSAGADYMWGGGGNDTYYVDNANDVVVERVGQGTADTIYTNAAVYQLSDYIEIANVWHNDIGGKLVANNTGSQLNGSIGVDTLIGGTAGDILNGGSGGDYMQGGLGGDVYFVDNISDIVIENAGEGGDIVHSSLTTYTLAANVDSLDFQDIYSTANLSFTGNDLDNEIVGANGNDTIHGGAGNDRLIEGNYAGATGNDVYYGDAGNDQLMAGTGNDTMYGGTGDDTFYIYDEGDVVIEYANEGNDIVWSTLGLIDLNNASFANIENARAGGPFEGVPGAPLWVNSVLIGNAGDNALYGGTGADTLRGGSGNDYLAGQYGNDWFDGGTGNDFLYGGLSQSPRSFGSDTYVFGSGYGNDTVQDLGYDPTTPLDKETPPTVPEIDILRLLGASTLPSSVTFNRLGASGNDLIVKYNNDASSSLTWANFFLGGNANTSLYRCERIEFESGAPGWDLSTVAGMNQFISTQVHVI
jgi:Ca2+-binding RTX toxin-like protein